jgi:hypothetical protein
MPPTEAPAEAQGKDWSADENPPLAGLAAVMLL